MLRMLPIEPARISTSQMYEKLKSQGIDIHVRSLQRDLKSLAKLFEIETDKNKDIPGWYWKKDANKVELPEMEPAVALSFRMVRLFLSKFMPPSTVEGLKPYFKNSENLLNNLSKNSLSNWNSKVALLSRNQPLLSPSINPELISNIYDGLLSEKQIDAVYETRKGETQEYNISPRAIVVVDQITYLVGTLWEYQDIRQFALHRFQFAETTERDNHPLEINFSLKHYISKGKFEYIVTEQESIKLELKVSKGIAKHLNESKLSEDQIIFETPEGLVLNATTKNTKQLRWWLLGFGDGIEVLKPYTLRDEFKQIAQKMSNKYS